MDIVLDNLQKPDWWFTGLFFLVIGLGLNWAAKTVPPYIGKQFRKLEAKNLKELKNIRNNAASMYYEIMKSWVLFLIFILFMLSLFAWISFMSINDMSQRSMILTLVVSSPTYFFEVYWLRQRRKVKKLIRLRGKLHITRR